MTSASLARRHPISPARRRTILPMVDHHINACRKPFRQRELQQPKKGVHDRRQRARSHSAKTYQAYQSTPLRLNDAWRAPSGCNRRRGRRLNDADLGPVAQLVNLRSLNFAGNKVKDLLPLAKLAELIDLSAIGRAFEAKSSECGRESRSFKKCGAQSRGGHRDAIPSEILDRVRIQGYMPAVTGRLRDLMLPTP